MKRLRLLLLIFAVACGLVLASAGAAFAAATNSALWCPNVSPDSTAQLGSLRIVESAGGSLKDGDWVNISLPSYTELEQFRVGTGTSSTTDLIIISSPVTVQVSNAGFTVSTVANTVYAFGEEAPLKEGELNIAVLSKNSFNLIVRKTWNPFTTLTLRAVVSFDQVKITPVTPEDLESSDIKVTLDAPSTSGFSSGSVTVGRLLTTAGSTVTAAAPTSISEVGGRIADITLKEDVAGALVANEDGFPGGNTVKLVLSPGFTWDMVTLIPQGGFGAGSIESAVYTEKNGCSGLYLKIKQASSGAPGQIIIKASVKANEPFTTARDVKVTYGGTNPGVGGEKIAEVTVAKYFVPGLSVAAKSTLDVVAGRANQQIGSFTLAEGMPGDLASGRFISLTLPEGARWNRLPTIAREAGNGELRPYGTIDDGRTVLYAVDKVSTARTVFCFKGATVDLAVYLPEELKVTVKGPGIEESVTVASIQALLAVSAAGGTVCIGVQEQAVGAVTIQENLVGVLRARDAAGNRAVLKLTLPAGVRFARKPTVAVTAGDLEIGDEIRLEDNDRTLVIPIRLSSATPVEKPVASGEAITEEGGAETGEEMESTGEAAYEQVGSTVVVDGILLTVDRTAPEGDIVLEVSGSALSETEGLFSSSLNKLTCVVARCATPAPVALRAEAVFTIGSTKYRVGAEEREMDVAPFVENGRTYLPIRYVGYAVGVSPEAIFWDNASRTATLLKGDRVVQLTANSKRMQLNAVAITMDVPAKIVGGRVVLPVRWVATALGCTVDWDSATQTVTVTQ